MRNFKSLFMLLFVAFFATNSFAQESSKTYVIQVATLDSYDQLVKNKDSYDYSSGLFAQKVGKRVKVYLLDYSGEYEMANEYYPGDRLNQGLKNAKEMHKGAFKRSDVKKEDLTNVWDIFEEYKNKKIPTEFSTKGGSTEVEAAKKPTYKIQLGVFKEEKSKDYIADRYGLNDAEKEKVEVFLTHDFTKVKKVICRRYYFGDYKTKAKAVAKKKALEKETDRKLILVEM